MTFRNGDDGSTPGETTPGGVTQGGHTRRRGNSIWWFGAVVVIAVAILVAMFSLPKKHAPAEANTAPVSTGMNVTAPGNLGPSAVPSSPPPSTAPAAKP